MPRLFQPVACSNAVCQYIHSTIGHHIQNNSCVSTTPYNWTTVKVSLLAVRRPLFTVCSVCRTPLSDWSVAQRPALTHVHCCNNYTGCRLTVASNTNCVPWCSTFNMVRHQSTSPNSANDVLTLAYVLVLAAISVYLELTCILVTRPFP